MASGTIEIVDVTPKTAVPGVETAFSVTVRYTSANIGGCVIYAGANTSESQRYALYDECVLPDTSGTYTFSFICTPAAWTDNAFGIYVNMSEYPHPDSWTPLDMDVYNLAAPPPTPTPTAPTAIDYITVKGEQYSTSLTELDLIGLNLTDADIEPLRYMTNLTFLDLWGNQISDVSSLKGLTNLTYLELGNNQISDISPLKGLTNLTGLVLGNNQISDVSPLKGLTNLMGLDLRGNQISDVSPLKGLTNLELLHLGYNKISDVSPLKELTNLTYLSLNDNPITDWSPVAHVQNVDGRP
jgi:Leucine-rich repeat (LRR) protein